MTLLELRQDLAMRLGLDTTASDGLVSYWDRKLLNQAARDIATLLTIPRGQVVYTRQDMLNGPLALPNDAEQALRAVVPPDVVVPILESDDYIAGDDDHRIPLQRMGTKALFIYDRSAGTLTYLGTRWDEPPSHVKIIYQMKYQEMVNDTDQPWNGQYARYHGIISALAAKRALLSLDPGEQETAMRYKAASDDYDVMLKALREEVDRLMIIGTNSMVPYMYARGRRWG